MSSRGLENKFPQLKLSQNSVKVQAAFGRSLFRAMRLAGKKNDGVMNHGEGRYSSKTAEQHRPGLRGYKLTSPGGLFLLTFISPYHLD